jgi:hypothetical protein
VPVWRVQGAGTVFIEFSWVSLAAAGTQPGSTLGAATTLPELSADGVEIDEAPA